MEKPQTLKVLGITLQNGMCQKVKKFLHRKIIDIEFSKSSEIKQIPKEELKKYDAIGIISNLSDELIVYLQDNPKA